ncbi:hypothetical protein J6590_051805 [Homalodisca vitripennis]|nr:hypothetical protein J6590_051805 [Homalodisca vitripennis]
MTITQALRFDNDTKPARIISESVSRHRFSATLLTATFVSLAMSLPIRISLTSPQPKRRFTLHPVCLGTSLHMKASCGQQRKAYLPPTVLAQQYPLRAGAGPHHVSRFLPPQHFPAPLTDRSFSSQSLHTLEELMRGLGQPEH